MLWSHVFCTATLSSIVIDSSYFEGLYLEHSWTLAHAGSAPSMMVNNLKHFEECTTFVTSEINNPATKHNPLDLNPQDTGDYMHSVGGVF
jgi:hypothetical protein